MADKVKPVGICDHCLGAIPKNRWYTRRKTPRLYCCRQCLNTANSHAGEPVRYEKLMRRIAKGEWRNPAKIRPPTSAEQSARARKGRLREVAAGTWRNPALSASARKKLSRPRKHTEPLHTALQKLKRGMKTSELTEDEYQAYLAYRARLRDARRPEINRRWRENYYRRKNNKNKNG